jgi:tetratricopeptide (TPR) repeat protein
MLQCMKNNGRKAIGKMAGICAVAMICYVASAQMADMPGMQHHHHDENEKLGSVSFPVSCEASSKAPMERGIALLHSFGYEEAEEQFTELTKSDPKCAMAFWGIAMSEFHELWGRPDKAAMDRGWGAIQQAQKLGGKTDRERRYIAALSSFYDPAKVDYQARVDAYTAAMLALHEAYPADVETSAFYALSLLADVAPDDTSLVKERKALAVLVPLFEKNPDHPGLAHYIIHTCDTPALAHDGLAAAQQYAQIASSSPHALHMPGHIFARLGMWQEDIQSNLASVAASEKAEAAGIPGAHHQLHADEFLLYAYLQTGQDAKAKALVDGVVPLTDRLDAMKGMDDMKDMSGLARNEFPAFYYLEMRDWQAASALKMYPATPAIFAMDTPWARGIANGRLHRAKEAGEDLTELDAEIAAYQKSQGGTPVPGLLIERNEVAAWQQYAEGKNDAAVETMRKAADQQDKLGQGEVDIPTREMLGDMLMELHRPKEALVEYKVALVLSPNRLNGLYGAGRAAEALGMKKEASEYYAAMLKNTENGTHSSRPSLAQAKAFVAGTVTSGD